MIFNSKSFWKYILFIVGTLLFFGGLGIERVAIQCAGVAIGVLLLALSIIWRGKIEFPPGILLYITFLAALFFGLNRSQNMEASLEYMFLFFSGGLFWVSFYNLKDKLEGGFGKLVIILGLLFGVVFILNNIFGSNTINGRSLYLPISALRNHNHIGDIWAVVVLVCSYYLIRRQKRSYLPLILIGICFLTISLSRAAYVSLAAGLAHIFIKDRRKVGRKKVYKYLALAIAALFVFAGAQKATLFSRPYYIQAIAGLIQNPLGIGMGNFRIISLDPAHHLWGMSAFSLYAFNIILEIFVGMGVFGLTFVVWLVTVFERIYKNNKGKQVLYQAIFIVLGINFLFDMTYSIATMVWIWFMSLGLSISEKHSGDRDELSNNLASSPGEFQSS